MKIIVVMSAAAALAFSVSTEAIANAKAASGHEVRAEDALGETIALPAPAARVVTIPMPAASVMTAVDRSSDRLAGMHRQSKIGEGGLLARLFPAFARVSTDVVGEGFAPNVEEILRVRPDLVFQWGDRGDALIAPLEAVGLTVAALKYGGEEELRDWLTLMAALTGQPERAEALIAWRESVQNRLAPLQALPAAEKPRVLYLLRARSGLFAAGDSTFNDVSIRLAGGRNAAAGLTGFKPVNAEQVLAWNPDVILLNTFEPGLTPDLIFDHPLLSMTDAARGRRVHVMPVGGYRWDPPSAESPLAWLWLAQKLQPTHSGLTDADLVDAAKDGFRLVYGKAVAEPEIRRILAGTGSRPLRSVEK